MGLLKALTWVNDLQLYDMNFEMIAKRQWIASTTIKLISRTLVLLSMIVNTGVLVS
jgi:hypothetical protein